MKFQLTLRSWTAYITLLCIVLGLVFLHARHQYWLFAVIHDRAIVTQEAEQQVEDKLTTNVECVMAKNVGFVLWMDSDSAAYKAVKDSVNPQLGGQRFGEQFGYARNRRAKLTLKYEAGQLCILDEPTQRLLVTATFPPHTSVISPRSRSATEEFWFGPGTVTSIMAFTQPAANQSTVASLRVSFIDVEP
jgi:hypothetical protein